MWDKIFGNDFLDMMQKAQITKEKMDILDFMKFLNFCASKNSIHRGKRQPKKWEKIIARTYIWYRINIQNIQRIPKINSSPTQFKNVRRTWIDISPKKIHKWPISTWKDAYQHYSSGECKSKSQWVL